MGFKYDKFETFTAANGISFSSKEVVSHLTRQAKHSTKMLNQKTVDSTLADIRQMSIKKKDAYARDTIRINTGNIYCS